jgi:hypothetical protein
MISTSLPIYLYHSGYPMSTIGNTCGPSCCVQAQTQCINKRFHPSRRLGQISVASINHHLPTWLRSCLPFLVLSPPPCLLAGNKTRIRWSPVKHQSLQLPQSSPESKETASSLPYLLQLPCAKYATSLQGGISNTCPKHTLCNQLKSFFLAGNTYVSPSPAPNQQSWGRMLT